jgi:hypothetical protein
MARKLAVADVAVAQAALTTLLCEQEAADAMEAIDASRLSEFLVEAADVRFQPTTRRLTLTFDLSGDAPAEFQAAPVPDPDSLVTNP